MGLSWEGFLGSSSGQCKGPEEGACLVCSHSKAPVSAVEGGWCGGTESERS